MTKYYLADVIESPISGEWGVEPTKDNGIKVIRTTNFTNEGRLDLANVVIRDIEAKKVEKKKLQYGDIIIEKSGGSPTQPVGRIVFFDVKNEIYLCNNFTAVLRPKEEVHPKYLFYLLYGLHLTKATLAFQNKTTGIINLKLNNYLKKAQIPLPPLAEQKRIAEVLDKANCLRQKDRQLLQKYDQLLQSVFMDMFGDPVKNEKGWEKVLLGSIGKWQSGGTPSRSNVEFFNGEIPWLSSGELNEMYVSESKECITEDAILKSNAKIIEPGSLLLGMYDTAALKSTITKVSCACNQAIAYSKLDSNKADTIFVYFLIQQAKQHYKSQQRGVRQKNLNLSIIKGLEIILPPLELQKKFSNTLKLVEGSRMKIREALSNEEQLFQSLLQKAFNGELALKEIELPVVLDIA